MAGDWPPKPDSAAVEAYVNENGRSAEALLAAARIAENTNYLQEAMDKFPTNKRVALAAYFNASTPENRRQFIDMFMKAAPENSLGFYLSAREHFAAGESESALKDVVTASRMTGWSIYAQESMLNAEEAYRATGASEAEAKAASGLALALPYLTRMKDIGRNLQEVSANYRAAGDEASAHATVAMGVQLASRLSHNSEPIFLIQELVGIAIEHKILEGVPGETAYDEEGRTAGQRLEELQGEKNEIKELGGSTDKALENMSEMDLVGFMDRWRMLGERDAVKWLNARQQPSL
jgi:hypothetical protein